MLIAFILLSLTRCLTGVLCFVGGISLNPSSNSQVNLNLERPLKSIKHVTQKLIGQRSRYVRGGHVSDERHDFELGASSDSTTADDFDQNVTPIAKELEVNGHGRVLKKTVDGPEIALNGDSHVLENHIESSTAETNGENGSITQKTVEPIIGRWPCGDELDKMLIKIALPCMANFAINPLVGAVDLFWINRMKNTLAVAGQAAANQIFTSSFWLFFLSAKYNCNNCGEGGSEGE